LSSLCAMSLPACLLIASTAARNVALAYAVPEKAVKLLLISITARRSCCLGLNRLDNIPIYENLLSRLLFCENFLSMRGKSKPRRRCSAALFSLQWRGGILCRVTAGDGHLQNPSCVGLFLNIAKLCHSPSSSVTCHIIPPVARHDRGEFTCQAQAEPNRACLGLSAFIACALDGCFEVRRAADIVAAA